MNENGIDYMCHWGGKDVSTLIDGEAITSENDLNKLRALELMECNKLNDSYVQLKYKVRKID